MGRFITADTIVPDPRNPQSLNRYSYALDNPLLYTDPTGHDFWKKLLGGIETFVGAVLAFVGEGSPVSYAGVALMAYGTETLGGDVDVNANTQIAEYDGSGGNLSNGGGSNSGGSGSGNGVNLGNTGISYTGPMSGYFAGNSSLSTSIFGPIVGGSAQTSGLGNGVMSYQTFLQMYGASGEESKGGWTGGIAIDAGYGAGSQWGAGGAKNEGTGVYAGFNHGKFEYGFYDYQAESNDIYLGKIGYGYNFSYYNTNASTYLDGESNYSAYTALIVSGAITYNNTTPIGWTVGFGKSYGLSLEHGTSKGRIAPVR